MCVCGDKSRALWAGGLGEQRHGDTQWRGDLEPRLPDRQLGNEMEESCGQCFPRIFPFNPNTASIPILLMRN